MLHIVTNKLYYIADYLHYFKEVPTIFKEIEYNTISNTYKYKQRLYNATELITLLEPILDIKVKSVVNFAGITEFYCSNKVDYFKGGYPSVNFINISMDKNNNFKYNKIESLLTTDVKSCIYGFQCRDLLKLGKTKNINNRYSQIISANPFASLKFVIPTKDTDVLEKYMHYSSDSHRFRGEWFTTSYYSFLEELIEHTGMFNMYHKYIVQKLPIDLDDLD